MESQLPVNQINNSLQPQPVMPEKRSVSPFLIIIGLLIAMIAGAGGMYLWQNYPEARPINLQPQEKACTMEAKLCPDGSSVGRMPPDCEFTPCPAHDSSIQPSLISPEPTSENAAPGGAAGLESSFVPAD